MDGTMFDDLSRTLSRKLPRRGALRLLGTALGALGGARLLPTPAMAKETPAFKASFLDAKDESKNVTDEAKKGRHRKKKKVRHFVNQCAYDASALESDCGTFCYNNYGFNTDFFLACAAQCTSCVPFLEYCDYPSATSCLTAFDVVW